MLFWNKLKISIILLSNHQNQRRSQMSCQFLWRTFPGSNWGFSSLTFYFISALSLPPKATFTSTNQLNRTETFFIRPSLELFQVLTTYFIWKIRTCKKKW